MRMIATVICTLSVSHAPTQMAHPFKLAGKWDFEECWPQGQDNACVLYSLMVAKGGKTGSLSIDGVQAYLRANVRINVYKNKAVVTMARMLEPSIGFDFKEGEVLFEMTFDEKGIATTRWQHLKPTVDTNRQPGTYFHCSPK